MAAPVKTGKDGKVTLGANTIVGMGTWSLDGITTEEFDSSSFTDQWKSYAYGMKDGGTITFNGHYCPADVTGVLALQQAQVYCSQLTSLRLYIDNTSYYEPCQTTNYFAPGVTITGKTVLSNVVITQVQIGADKSALETISFTGKLSGLMVLV